VQLEEKVRASSGGSQLAFKETFVDTFLGDIQLSTSATFAPQTVLHITKDVYVFNDLFIGGEFEHVGFGQVFSSVPVPATAGTTIQPHPVRARQRHGRRQWHHRRRRISRERSVHAKTAVARGAEYSVSVYFSNHSLRPRRPSPRTGIRGDGPSWLGG
jgi:hypothetical protein